MTTPAHQAAARIREALEAGPTPGPWKIDVGHQSKQARGISASSRNIVNFGGIAAPASKESAANAALIAACSPDNLRALLAERDELAKDAARWRLIAGHWKDASMRWKKEPNVPKSITITVDFGVVAAEAAQIEGFLDEAVRAALTNKD